jgi:hypothetical protein
MFWFREGRVLLNCEICDLERSFELDQIWDFNFGDLEIANSFQKNFHCWKLIWSVANTQLLITHKVAT